MTFYPDVVGKLVIELRDDPAVDAIVAGRVRGFEPKSGDADGPKNYKAHVVIVQLASERISQTAVQRFTCAIRCYGLTPPQAAELRWACSNALHLAGGRLHDNGLHIYQTVDESGGEQLKDPDTDQPYQIFIVTGHASTLEVVPTGS